MKIITRLDAENYRELVNICETTRGHLDGALNRMHLATTYEELEEWYEYSKMHLRELDKVLCNKVQFIIEHSEEK